MTESDVLYSLSHQQEQHHEEIQEINIPTYLLNHHKNVTISSNTPQDEDLILFNNEQNFYNLEEDEDEYVTKTDIIEDLLKTEEIFVKKMSIFFQKFISPLQKSNFINSNDLERMFHLKELENIFENIKIFYNDLINCKDEIELGNLFLNYLMKNIIHFINYCNQVELGITVINNFKLKEKNFKVLISKLEQLCGENFEVTKIMLLPLERILEYSKFTIFFYTFFTK